jgi:flavorubredoxin
VKAIVVYDSKFGNTERIARALAAGLGEHWTEVVCIRCDQVGADRLGEYGFVAVGGPTQYHTVSETLRLFLDDLAGVDLRGKKGFAFDTRIQHRFSGSAAKKIQSKMKRRKMDIVRPCASAIVVGREGPLQEGEERRFKQIGIEIGSYMH